MYIYFNCTVVSITVVNIMAEIIVTVVMFCGAACYQNTWFTGQSF